jgi:hypothetical protein
MTSACGRAIALLTLVAACGHRRLDLQLTFGDGCTMISVPAGSSLQYEVSANDVPLDDAGQSAFCGACLMVPNQLDGSDAVIAFLRANAPRCPGVSPNGALLVRLTGFSSGTCDGSELLCAQSPAVTVPDGTADAQLAAPLTCRPCSAQMNCVPMSCQQQGKNCGPLSDGCTTILQCGTCTPPMKCGIFTAGVCSHP